MPAHRSVRSPLPAFVAGISLLVLLAIGTTTPAYAADEAVIDGVTYELLDSADPAQGATAVAYDEAMNPRHPELVLPPSVVVDGETVPVVEVGYEAFRDADLESVALPSTMVTLGMFAFAENGALSAVELNDGLRRISNLAFRDAALTAIDIPDTVSQINFQAFRGNELVEVELPAGLSRMGGGVFYDNPTLERVRFNGPHPQLLFDSGNPIGSTDAATDPVIEFLWRDGQDQVPTGTDGYIAPLMWDYRSVALAEVTFMAHGSVHATRLVPLDQAGDDGFWGTIDAADMPDEPTRDGHEFGYWIDYGTLWTPGDRVTGDLTLNSSWVDLTWVQHIVLTATPDEATVGEPVTLSAEGFNSRGDSLGDITDEITFDDPNDSSMVLDGRQVTFTEAGTYTITGRHNVTERPVSLAIDVRPAATTVADNEEDGSTVPERDHREALPATGAEITAWTAVAGILALILGTWLLTVTRRRNLAREVTL